MHMPDKKRRAVDWFPHRGAVWRRQLLLLLLLLPLCSERRVEGKQPLQIAVGRVGAEGRVKTAANKKIRHKKVKCINNKQNSIHVRKHIASPVKEEGGRFVFHNCYRLGVLLLEKEANGNHQRLQPQFSVLLWQQYVCS